MHDEANSSKTPWQQLLKIVTQLWDAYVCLSSSACELKPFINFLLQEIAIHTQYWSQMLLLHTSLTLIIAKHVTSKTIYQYISISMHLRLMCKTIHYLKVRCKLYIIHNTFSSQMLAHAVIDHYLMASNSAWSEFPYIIIIIIICRRCTTQHMCCSMFITYIPFYIFPTLILIYSL